MSWRLRLSVETILRLTPAVLGSTVFSIAGLCAAHACLDDQALLAAREAIGSSLQTLGSVYAVLLAFVVFVVWERRRDKGLVDGTFVLSTALLPPRPPFRLSSSPPGTGSLPALPGTTALFEVPIQSRPDRRRVGLDVAVDWLGATIRAVEKSGATVEHLNDY